MFKCSFIRSTVGQVHRFVFLVPCLGLILLANPRTSYCYGQVTADLTAKTEAYIQAINRAREQLDAGQSADALKGLNETDPMLRSFEFEYLKHRAELNRSEQKSPDAGGAAPDLIRKIAKPAVEARYGILNGVNRQMVFICKDGGLQIHDLAAPEKEARVEKHPADAMIWTGAFSQNGKYFLTGHHNSDVLVWDATTWKIRQTISIGEEWPVRELAVSPDGTAFVAESKDDLELWSLSGDLPKRVAGVGQRYNFGEGLAFSPTGDKVATGGMFEIILHDATNGNRLRSMHHASYTMGLEFSPDGKRIASAPRGNVNRFLAVFDITQDRPVFNAGPFGNYIAGMAFTPDGKRIVATGCEKEMRIFDSATGLVVLSFKRTECGAKPGMTQDGRLLGWNEPDGFYYIELGKAEPAKTDPAKPAAVPAN